MKNNKIRDISPASESKPVIIPKESKPKEKPVIKKKKIAPKEKRHFPKLLIIIPSIIIVLAVIWLTSSFYSKLSLEIKPRTEEIVFQQEIEVNVNQDALNIQDKIVPGQFFDGNKEGSMVFKTKGVATDGQKAEGIIKVYNSHNPPRTFGFRETTRFLSAEGARVFRAPDKVFLPAGTLKGGKVEPSVTEVRVVAQEAGEDYNIGKSNFSVPGLAGSSFYYSIWAESDQAMTGGYIKEVNMVTEQGLDEAKIQLRKELIRLAKQDIEANLPEDYVLREDFFFIKTFDYSCDKESGDKVDEITCTGSIVVKGLGFKLSDIREIVMDQLKQEIPSEKSYDSNSLILEFIAKNLVSESGKLILDFETIVNVYDKLSEEIISLQVKGLHEKQIQKDIFENYPFIESVKSNFWPFWVKKAPKVLERIDVLIKP